jgi:hypothetical protein
MKNPLLAVALLAASTSVVANENFNGRLTGMSGAGYVTADYVDGVLSNPSLGAAFGERDDFAVVLNVGAVGSDKDDLIDAMDDLVDYIDLLDNITNYRDLDPGMATRLIDHIRDIENKTVYVQGGASLVVAIPNEYLSASLVVKANAHVGAATLIDQGDYDLIRNSVNNPFDTADLKSSVIGKGALVTEVGVALAKTLFENERGRLLVGVTPKRVTVETIAYHATVANYDEDDFDADEYTLKSSTNSFDAGVTLIDGNLRYGLVVKDAISKEFAAVNGEKMRLKPLATAAVGYQSGWWTAEAALDLNTVTLFGLNGDVQILRAGVEVSPWSWLQLRAGLQRDLESTLENTYSVGVGFNIMDTFNLDIAGVTGDNKTYGGAIQLGLRF